MRGLPDRIKIRLSKRSFSIVPLNNLRVPAALITWCNANHVHEPLVRTIFLSLYLFLSFSPPFYIDQFSIQRETFFHGEIRNAFWKLIFLFFISFFFFLIQVCIPIGEFHRSRWNGGVTRYTTYVDIERTFMLFYGTRRIKKIYG